MQNGTAEDGWVTLAEAATLLGLSVDTVRRRVKRGELEAQMVPTERGAAYRVRLPSAPGPAPSVGSPEPTVGSVPRQDANGAEAAELAALVRDLQADLLRRTEAAAVWQTRADLLAMQLEQARAELRALQAPQDAPESPVAPHLGAEAPEPTTEPSAPPAEPPPLAPDPLPPKPDGRQPWWQRLVRWVVVL